MIKFDISSKSKEYTEKRFGLIEEMKPHPDAIAYQGGEFRAGQNRFIYRQGKVTQKLDGFFLSFYKRNAEGKPCPYAQQDFEYLFVELDGLQFFLFPSKSLADNGYLKSEKCKGKLGFRLYKSPQKLLSWSRPFLSSYDDSNS